MHLAVPCSVAVRVDAMFVQHRVPSQWSQICLALGVSPQFAVELGVQDTRMLAQSKARGKQQAVGVPSLTGCYWDGF